MKLATEVSVFSSGHKANFTESAFQELPSFHCFMNSFLKLAETRMSDAMKKTLMMSAQHLRFHVLTITSLADKISRKSSMPYSTVKWNLRYLMRLGLIDGGDSNHRGKVARLTKIGCFLVQHME